MPEPNKISIFTRDFEFCDILIMVISIQIKTISCSANLCKLILFFLATETLQSNPPTEWLAFGGSALFLTPMACLF